MRVFALRPYHPSAGRVYQPAASPERRTVTDYHRFELRLHLDLMTQLERAIAEVEERITDALASFRLVVERLTTIHGISTYWLVGTKGEYRFVWFIGSRATSTYAYASSSSRAFASRRSRVSKPSVKVA
jgi:hypothetical protein